MEGIYNLAPFLIEGSAECVALLPLECVVEEAEHVAGLDFLHRPVVGILVLPKVYAVDCFEEIAHAVLRVVSGG